MSNIKVFIYDRYFYVLIYAVFNKSYFLLFPVLPYSAIAFMILIFSRQSQGKSMHRNGTVVASRMLRARMSWGIWDAWAMMSVARVREQKKRAFCSSG